MESLKHELRLHRVPHRRGRSTADSAGMSGNNLSCWSRTPFFLLLPSRCKFHKPPISLLQVSLRICAQQTLSTHYGQHIMSALCLDR